MTKVLFTRRAEQDLEEIGDYIAADNPERARSFLQEIRTRCQKIGIAPLAYAVRPELGDDIRACHLGRYIIFFRVRTAEETIVIVRVLHSARDLGRVSW